MYLFKQLDSRYSVYRCSCVGGV